MPSSFRCAGATGQAPTTSFFGPIPDRLSMLLPSHVADPGFGLWRDSAFSALLVSKWTIFNTSFISGANQNSVSLGAFTTAPDGTTNAAQKIVESNANSQHFLSAGYFNAPTQFVAGQTPYRLRVAVFAKAAERTRIVLVLGAQDAANCNCRTVFDLANGVVGVAPTVTNNVNSAWTAGPAAILPFGNGWYCCQIDVNILGAGGGGNSGLLARFYLDNGSGSAAESSTYAGNGTSGVYAWKSTMLPPGAWALNSVPFFDDFLDNSMSQIDLTDSLGPNFKWYLHQHWPQFPWQLNTPAANLSNASSVLTLAGATDANSGMTITTLAPTGPNTYTGRGGFRPPGLFEAKWGWNENVNFTFGTAFWTTCVERLITPILIPWNPGDPTTNPLFTNNFTPEIEMDWAEQQGGGTPPWTTNTIFSGSPPLMGEQVGLLTAMVGFPVWTSIKNYNTNQIVFQGGTTWIAQRPNAGVTPGTDVTAWLPWTNASAASPNLVAPDIPAIDLSQLHVWSVLWLPSKYDELGQVLNFFEGNFCGQQIPGDQAVGAGQLVYGPHSDRRNAFGTGFQRGDGLTYPVVFSGAWSGAPLPVYIDWVKVTA